MNTCEPQKLNIMLFIISLYYFVFNFYVVRRLRVWWSLNKNSKVILTKEKHLPDHLLNELIVLFIVLILPYAEIARISIISGKVDLDLAIKFIQIYIISLLIWIGIFFLKKLEESEISYLNSVNNLTLGYGVAIWYYKNYLDKILPDSFRARVSQFQSMEGVKLPCKLYILCPKSCRVQKYIDRTEYIEFSKDLPPHKIDHGGIVGRKYSISVYRVKYNGEFFRCALEYAQPLKTLLAFQENGRIPLSQMYIERESFIKNLTLMLKDHKNSFEVCELVEYDDETQELHEILSNLPSVQDFKSQTVE